MIAALVAALVTFAQTDSVIVDARYKGADGTRVQDTPTYRTIASALRAARANASTPFELHIRNGRYYEKLSVERPNVRFIGQHRDSTLLTYDAAAGHKSPTGGTWGTSGSFTLRVSAPDFQLENMTVENGFDYMSNYRRPNGDPSKLVGAQGVAVILAQGSDRALFRRCNIVGHQDTLFPDAGRSYFTDCTISGSVDFIFGAGQAVFQNVDIISRDRSSTSNNGYITAPSTPITQPFGFLFIDCRLKKESRAMAAGTVTLGRPWHPSGDPNAIGSAVFLGCTMDDHIAAKGWESMYSTNAAGTRTLHLPEEARFFESGSSGPGALRSVTRRWLSEREANQYASESVLAGWRPDGRTSAKAALPITTPRLHTYRGELLAQSKQRLRSNDPALISGLAKLIADADSVFRTGPYTVTAKQRTPPSGDKRDYQSFAPYWWPDPTKPDGLPYIQRDGQFNMELRRDSDVLRWYALTDAVETLAQAWYFTDRPEYAHRAAHLLRVWFLNDSTRMNPHLTYAQAILGRTEGRGIGIIDTRDLGRLFDAVTLLQGSSAWSDVDAAGLHDWAVRYLDWLLTSQYGQEEAATKNNHGTWYDVQIAALALFVGDTTRARATLENAKALRIATQIDAEGKQPLELARTRSLHYSVENLDGFSRLAEMARTLGIDLWNWSAPKSGGIRKAIAFVRPYSDPTLKWPHPQITEEPADLFVLLLRRADDAYGERVSTGIPAEIVRTHRAQLLYPEPQMQADDLLAPARIAALPAAERDAWRAYIARSQAHRKKDLDAINAELRAAGQTRWTPAPVGSGFSVTDAMNADWFKTKEALALADAIVSYQTPTGGWSKRVDFKRSRARGQSFASEDGWDWIGTLDNGATTEQLVFLAGVVRAQGKPQHRAALERGIEYLLMSQYPTGCWPQIYPIAGGYHDAATFNDDATVHALQVLRSLARGEYNFGTVALRQRAASAVERGVSCIIATQVEVAGRKTVWGAQHDPITFQPVKARTYEHASLSGRESAAILDFLMQVESPSAEIVQAVHAGAAWFRASAIRGYGYVPRGVLTEKPDGGPLWARFYELGTNKPIFSDRDGVVKYSLSQIGEERRTGYLWYTDEPNATLRRYDAWARRHPLAVR